MSRYCFYCGKSEKCSGLRYFHKFPTDLKACKAWLRQMDIEANLEGTKNSRLCSDHFRKDCYVHATSDRSRLAPGSVPTKFGNFHLKCVCCDNVKIRGSKKSFRKFPLKNAELLKKWLEAIGKENFYPNERSVICDDHFAKKSFSRNNGYLHLKVDTFPTIFSRCSEDANRTGPIEVTDSLTRESEVTHSIAPIENCNLTSQRNNDSSMLPMKNRKRLSTEELPDPKYLKLIKNEDKHSVMDESGSVNNAGSFHDQEEENATAEATAPDTATRYCAQETSYLFFCFLLSFVLWLFAFVISNLGTKTSQSVDSMVVENEAEVRSASETSSRQNSEKVSEVPSTPRRIQLLKHDRHYEASPRGLKKRYRVVRTKLENLQRESKVQRQHVSRLKKKITTLSEIVSDLRRTRVLPEDALACLDSIAESDISQLISRFLKNQNSIGDKKPARKRLFKSQRKNKLHQWGTRFYL